MKNLEKIVFNYLKNFNHKFLITDEYNNYSKKEIILKIKKYQNILNSIWKNSQNRGVALLLPRDADYICLILATWLSKGYYLPLSLETPKKNIKYQINDSKVNILVEKKNNEIVFRKLNIKSNSLLIQENYKKIAYIIFTSGSTGKKKGVCISSKSFSSYIESVKKFFKIKKSPKSIAISGELTFDITIADFAFAFIFGSQIIITGRSQNFISLLSMIKNEKVESIYLVPSALDKFLDFSKKVGINNLKSIKQINLGGERFNVELLAKIKKYLQPIKVYNFYGPTEFTVNSMCHEVNMKRKYEEIPIGKPLPGVFTKLKNNELYLSGNQKMLGYVNFKSPFIKFNNKIYYKTGDIVKKNQENEFIFESRAKEYIKLDGYRINLSRIENIIFKHLLLPIKITIYKNKILMFVEYNKKDKNILIKKIKLILSAYLEKYEQPMNILIEKKFPTLDSGKMDVNKLLLGIKL